MDGPTVFLGIVIIAVTAMVIYMFIDVSKYKTMTDQELKDNDKDITLAKEEAATKLATETKERQTNVNYIIDKTNEANQNLYTRFDNDVTSMKNNLNTLNASSANLSSVMRVTGGTAAATGTTATGTTATGTTATGTTVGGSVTVGGTTVAGGVSTNTAGRAITELPGSGTPNLELISSVMATNGMTVRNSLKTDKLQVGDKFLFSGVGDAHANDDWLRMFNKEGTGYNGGLAMNKLWTGNEAHLGGATNVRGNLNVRGGSSEHNPDGWWTHLPWNGDNKNYIRGDTEIRGNTNNIGDLNVGRNANVQGRLHFSDTSMDKKHNGPNSSDSYYLEKKVSSPNVSHLRLTLNDDNDESMQIWGGSCAAGNCADSEGTMKHKFDASGNATHAGGVTGNRGGPWSSSVSAKAPLLFDSLYALKFGDSDDPHLHQAGMGLIRGQPNKKYASDKTLATHIKSDTDYTLYSSGWDPLMSVQGGTGAAYIKGPLKVRHPHADWTDNASISTQATGQQVGASFAGEQLWSHFPWMDQNTYIRPGKWDNHVVIGDIGNSVYLGRNDGGGITQVRSHQLRTRRHIDADLPWGPAGTALFTGWMSDKSVLGNWKTGGHDVALNAPANTVVATNPLIVYGDVDATRICAGNVCVRGDGNNLIMESKDRSKSKVVSAF